MRVGNRLRVARDELPEIADNDPAARSRWNFTWAEIALRVYDPRVPPDRRVLNALRFGDGPMAR